MVMNFLELFLRISSSKLRIYDLRSYLLFFFIQIFTNDGFTENQWNFRNFSELKTSSKLRQNFVFQRRKKFRILYNLENEYVFVSFL
jgi:hypothetical protein